MDADSINAINSNPKNAVYSDELLSGEIDGTISFTGGFIQSKGFISGSTGWRLSSDGTFEANSGTFRGSLTAGSIDIPDTATANSFHVNSSGDTWWGATTIGSSLASITKAGAARFQGMTSLNIKSYTCFETAGRFTSTAGGTGTNTFGTSGLELATGATATSFALTTWFTTQDVFANSPTFSTVVNFVTLNAASGGGAAFFGLGELGMAGSGTTFAGNNFCGFWLQKANPVVNVYAVQNNASGSQTTSSVLTTVTDNDSLDLILKMNGTTSVDYYWRKNSGALSAKTTLSATVPTGVANKCQFSTTNVSSAFQFSMIVISTSYER